MARLVTVFAALSLLLSCGGLFDGGGSSSLPPPTILSPINDPSGASPVSPLTVTLSWQPISGASHYTVELVTDGIVKSATTFGSQILAAQVWGYPLAELAEYSVTVTAAGADQTSPSAAATFFTLPDSRTGLWVFGDSLADGSGNGLDGHVPTDCVAPDPVEDRHECSDAALLFSEGAATAVAIDPPESGEWPELGTGISFSVWVRLPGPVGATSIKDEVVFAKPHPDGHQIQHEHLYTLLVDYEQGIAGYQTCTFRFFVSDTTDGQSWIFDTVEFPEIAGDSLLGDQWVHVAASYDYGSSTVMLMVNGELVPHTIFAGAGFVWDDEGKNFKLGESGLLIGAAIQGGEISPAFDGEIDDLILWDRALSSDELLSLLAL